MAGGPLLRARRVLESRNMSLVDIPIWAIGMSKLPAHVMTAEIEWLPREVTFDNYIKIFEYPVIRWGINSIIQAVGSTTLCVLFGAMAGYALARMKFPGNNLIFVIFLASLMIPVEVPIRP
jgi:multiple sugar transport system permease protein